MSKQYKIKKSPIKKKNNAKKYFQSLNRLCSLAQQGYKNQIDENKRNADDGKGGSENDDNNYSPLSVDRLYADKSLGQHFLLDENIVAAMVNNIIDNKNNNKQTSITTSNLDLDIKSDDQPFLSYIEFDELIEEINKLNETLEEDNPVIKKKNRFDKKTKESEKIDHNSPKSIEQKFINKEKYKENNFDICNLNPEDKSSNREAMRNTSCTAQGNIKQDIVVEIGPGLGILTEAIARLSRPKKLVIIEHDARFIKHLEGILSHYDETDSTVILADAMKIDEIGLLQKYGNINSKIILIANLPYNIATSLLFKWLEKIDLFSSITVMLQREVALRVAAPPASKNYGWLSIIAQLICDVSILVNNIPPESFWPAPKVDSAVIKMVPHNDHIITPAEWEKLQTICKPCFNQRRKMLRNVLPKSAPGYYWDKEATVLDKRAEELSPQDWLKLVKNAELL